MIKEEERKKDEDSGPEDDINDIMIKEEERKKDEDSGPEDEEVPTRGYLKRQSNLILDAKSRSKKGGKRR